MNGLNKRVEYQGDIEEVKKIYVDLKDDISKWIFKQRFLYYLTKEQQCLQAMVKNIMHNQSWYSGNTLTNFIKTQSHNLQQQIVPNILFGAGATGEWILHYLYGFGIEITCFCDSDPQKIGTIYCGKTVIAVDELLHKFSFANVIISSGDYGQEIYEMLCAKGFPREQIILTEKLFYNRENKEKQYFDSTIVPPQQDEVFVDVGCCNGMTIDDFIEWNSEYKEIIAFEPDEVNYEKCLERIKANAIKNVRLFKAGLWSNASQISFAAKNNGSSAINENGAATIAVEKLDNLKFDSRITYIKMDIEGAELEALKGSIETIRRDKPRLAISIYHKPEDIWQIPLLLKEILPDYHFYLRQYSQYGTETVLYAVL